MKNVKILTISIAVILVTMVAFGGVYIKTQNRMENKVKDYQLAMNLKGARNVKLMVNDENDTIIKDQDGKTVEDSSDLTDAEIAEKGYTKEEKPVNDESVKTADNYKKSKKIIEERLKSLGVEDYIVRVNETSGEIYMELADDSKVDTAISSASTQGKFEIKDTETEEVLMDNNDIKNVEVKYGSDNSSATSTGTRVFLNIEFNKEGTKKLEEISKKYVKSSTDSSETENSEETTENQQSEKTITMEIDGQKIMSTSFEETVSTGLLQLSVGSASTDTSTLQGYLKQASNMATILKSGNMPVSYELEENEFVFSGVKDTTIAIIIYVMLALSAIALIILIVKYKALGAIGTISFIGLASLLLLIIRYTNVLLSLEGIVGIGLVLILEYIFINSLLAKLNKKDFDKKEINKANKETYKEFFIKIIPVIIMIITFSLIKWAPISSFGMVMFWGILLIAIYNIIITNGLLQIRADSDTKVGGKK